MQRTQIYLDDEQHRALMALAKRRSTTASALIRSAIDDYLSGQLTPEERLARLRILGAKFAGAADGRRSDSRAIVDNIRAADATRLDSSA